MFSGIVEEVGRVEKIEHKKNLLILHIRAKKVLKGNHVGDSVAVNGVCLTIAKFKKNTMVFELMKETVSHTTLKDCQVGSPLNLERPLKWGGRIGGHFVLGHVDGTGTIRKRIKEKNYVALYIEIPKKLSRFLIDKGSVAIDGISLTVGKIKGNIFTVHLIPHTLKSTTLKYRKESDQANIETDFLAKYLFKNR